VILREGLTGLVSQASFGSWCVPPGASTGVLIRRDPMVAIWTETVVPVVRYRGKP
jgi:hypothetical protein